MVHRIVPAGEGEDVEETEEETTPEEEETPKETTLEEETTEGETTNS